MHLAVVVALVVVVVPQIQTSNGGHGGAGVQLPSTFRDTNSSVGASGPGGGNYWVAGGGGGAPGSANGPDGT